jgi:hypothetical protein
LILRSLRLVHPSSAEYVASNTFSSDHYSWHSYRAAVGTASRTQLLSCLLTKAATCISSSLPLSNADVYSRSLRLAEERRVSEGDPRSMSAKKTLAAILSETDESTTTPPDARVVARVGMIRSCRSPMNVLGRGKHRWITIPEFVSGFWPGLFLLRIRPFRK